MQVPASLIGPVIIGRKHCKLRALETGTGTSIFVPRLAVCNFLFPAKLARVADRCSFVRGVQEGWEQQSATNACHIG
eukprot:749806-Hanusia_phi.AAC.12